MYKISGSNLHGQWFSTQPLLRGFQDINSICEESSTIQEIELVCLTWSYNVFLLNNDFYLSGAWCGKESAFVKIELPTEKNAFKNLVIVGNDYKLFLVNIKTFDVWILNFDDTLNLNWTLKKHYFRTANSLEILDSVHTVCKKLKIDNFIRKTVATHYSLCILMSDGVVFELPNKLETNHFEGKVCDIDYGYEHGILLTNAGIVYTWGNGKRCQLGHGDLISLEEPTKLEALAGVKISKIKAGGWHCLALSSSGDLYSWGWNDTGQLGIRENSIKECLKSYPVPTLVDLYEGNGILLDVNIIDIGCGSKHSVILLDDNTVWTSGSNKYGQLGFSEKEILSLNYFKKSFYCCSDTRILCGPWCSVLHSLSNN